MASNDFLPFAAAGGANVVTQAAYAGLAALSTGYQSGVANSAQLNKTWRQSSIMAAVLAQLIADTTGANATDDGTTATLLANLKTALQLAGAKYGYATDTGAANACAVAYSPVVTALTDGMVLWFKAAAANTGATTLNVNGLGASPVVGAAQSALQGNEIIANGRCMVVWNATITSWVLLECTGGALQIAPAVQLQQAAQLGQVGHGQCRLSVASATSLKLAPYNGNNLIINGVPQQIPSAGVTVSNASLAASTLYYVYATWTGSAIALVLSTTGHSTGTNGVEIQTGTPAATLVGMIYTNASSQFVDAAATRFCLNWFNRKSLAAANIFAASRSTTSTALVEISSTERAQFLSWADEVCIISVSAVASQNTVGSFSTQGTLDAGTLISLSTISPPLGQDSACGSSGPVLPTEGFHYATVYGNATSGFTATWPPGITGINALIRG